MPRTPVWLVCEQCEGRNYRTTKKGGEGVGKIEVRKFCPKCRKHTLHKERKGK
ncbi:MAG: 50S ribosomal protein L33 [Planctomycetota bacterium]|nr:50S ribosomal protein L33 [Planctomycetota bacterium]